MAGRFPPPRRYYRRNPFLLEEGVDLDALSFDPYQIQTGAFSFDPQDARTHIFADERVEELAIDALSRAVKSDLDWRELGRAVTRSWGIPGFRGGFSRKLRSALLANPRVEEAFEDFLSIWLQEADRTV